MEALKSMVNIAASQVGVREEGGNNQGPQIVEYQKATWLKPAAWPWCAAFVCWVIREWLTRDINAADNIGITEIEQWRPKTASAYDFINWAKERNLQVFDRKTPAKLGDIVVFDFSHIGIVEADQKPNSKIIQTIEGNTNGKGERDSLAGDGVWRKKRATNLIRAYIRIA